MAGDSGLLHHWPALVRVARSVLASREDAEDCAATAIAQFCERTSAANVQNVEAYLVTVTKRRAYDLLRSQMRECQRLEHLAAHPLSDVPDIADLVASREQRRRLEHRAAELLPPTAYGVLVGVADGAPIAMVAQDLGLTQRAAESHLLRARRVMRSAVVRVVLLFGAVWSSLRRGLPAAALATAPAACLAFALMAPSPSTLPTPARLSPSVGRLVGTAEPGVILNTTRAAARSARGRAAHLAAPVPRESGVVTAEPIRGARTTLSRGSTGERETGPLQVIAHCLRDLRVDPQQIGCSGPRTP